jgi:hypothetical protein
MAEYRARTTQPDEDAFESGRERDLAAPQPL